MAMLPMHREILREKRIYLLKNVQLDPLFMAFFQTDRTLTDEMVAEIMEPRVYTNRERVAKLLDRLPARGAMAFKHLLEALIETDQEHIAIELDRNNEMVQSHTDQTDSSRAPSNDVTNIDVIIKLKEHGGPLRIKAGEKFPKLDKKKQHTDYPLKSKPHGNAVIVYPDADKSLELEKDVNLLDSLFGGLHFTVRKVKFTNEQHLMVVLNEETSVVDGRHQAVVFFILRCPKGISRRKVLETIESCKDPSGNAKLLRKAKLVFLQDLRSSEAAPSEENPNIDRNETIPKRVDGGNVQSDSAEVNNDVRGGRFACTIIDQMETNLGSVVIRFLSYTFAEYAVFQSLSGLIGLVRGAIARDSEIKKRQGLEIMEEATIPTFYFNP